MERTYRISDTVSETFLRLPLSLFANPEYGTISAEAKLIYALLLDRMTLSQKNQWINEENEVYLIYTREEISATLNISYKKAIAAFKELIAVGLLYEQRQGRGFPNRLFVLKTELEDKDAKGFSEEFNKEDSEDSSSKESSNRSCQQIVQSGSSRTAKTACLENESNTADSHTYSEVPENKAEMQPIPDNTPYELPKMRIKDCESGISRTAKTACLELPKSHSIQTDNIYIKNNYTEKNQSVNQSECDRLTELVEKCELTIFEGETRQMFTDAITRLYYSGEFKIGHAVLPKDRIRSVLSRLTADHLLCVLDTMRRNTVNIKNPTGYLMALIINTVCEQKSDLILSLPPEYQGDDYYAPE